jgi:hypothetical protein
MGKSIFQLSSIDTLATGDLLAIGDASNTDTRKASLAALVTFLNSNLTFPAVTLARQAASPAATGFSVTVLSGDTWLILTPLAGYAAGEIVLPTGSNGAIVTVNCTQAVTTLTITATGTASVVGAPATLVANDYFTLKYDLINDSWYRIA